MKPLYLITRTQQPSSPQHLLPRLTAEQVRRYVYTWVRTGTLPGLLRKRTPPSTGFSVLIALHCQDIAEDKVVETFCLWVKLVQNQEKDTK